MIGLAPGNDLVYGTRVGLGLLAGLVRYAWGPAADRTAGPGRPALRACCATPGWASPTSPVLALAALLGIGHLMAGWLG
jgi:hypothetical protein